MIELTGQVRVRRLTGTINIIPSESGGGGPLQAKTAFPSHSEQVIAPDDDYYGLVAVTVKAVPRMKAMEPLAVTSEGPTEIETPLLEFCEMSVKSYYSETTITDIPYEIHAGGWFLSGSGTSATSDPVVTYSFPATAGSTYTITMTEIGNRLRYGLSSVDPDLITGDTSGTVSGYQDITSDLAVGYTFTCTASANGWLLVYVSNQNERPSIKIMGQVKSWIEE